MEESDEPKVDGRNIDLAAIKLEVMQENGIKVSDNQEKSEDQNKERVAANQEKAEKENGERVGENQEKVEKNKNGEVDKIQVNINEENEVQ